MCGRATEDRKDFLVSKILPFGDGQKTGMKGHSLVSHIDETRLETYKKIKDLLSIIKLREIIIHGTGTGMNFLYRYPAVLRIRDDYPGS